VDERAPELVFRAVRDTLLEHGADVSSHPFDMLQVPDRRLWTAVWARLKMDLDALSAPKPRRRLRP
jgi:hypothetical protein